MVNLTMDIVGRGLPALATTRIDGPTSPLNKTNRGLPFVVLQKSPDGTVSNALPERDVDAQRWTDHNGNDTDLWSVLDDTSTTDYAKSPVDPAGRWDSYTVSLSPLLTPMPYGTKIRYHRDRTGTDALAMTVRLLQGQQVIASWVESSVPDTAGTYEYSLTNAEIDAITNGNDLRLRFEPESGVFSPAQVVNTYGPSALGSGTLTNPGVLNGSLLVVALETTANPVISPPTGWVLADVVYYALTTGYMSLYYKIADNEPGSWSWTMTNTNAVGMALLVLPDSPNATKDVSANGTAANVTTLTVASLTTTVRNTIVISATMEPGSRSYTWPNPMIEVVDAGLNPGLHIAYEFIANPGATGTRSVTINSVANVSYVTAAFKRS